MTTFTPPYTVSKSIVYPDKFIVLDANDRILTHLGGWSNRYFKTRNGARKAITRQLRGDFHK